MRLTALLTTLLLLLPAVALARTINVSKKPASRSLSGGHGKRKHRHAATGSQSASASTRHHRGRYRRVIFEPTPLKGSRESLLRQNERTASDDLERMHTEDDLLDAIDRKDLVALPDTESVRVASNLPPERRYCRPWTRTFVEDISDEYFKEFSTQLQVTSAVRTEQVQRKLRRRNHNAADVEGDLASPHLTGATIDIGKAGMGKAQKQWMRDYLLQLRDAGQIDVAEEFRTRCFHITVYREYEESRLSQPGMLAAPAKSVTVDSSVLPPGPVATPITPNAGSIFTNEDLDSRYHAPAKLAE